MHQEDEKGAQQPIQHLRPAFLKFFRHHLADELQQVSHGLGALFSLVGGAGGVVSRQHHSEQPPGVPAEEGARRLLEERSRPRLLQAFAFEV